MSASAANMAAIVKAKQHHNAGCPFPPHTVVMAPFELTRLGWEVGDEIAGLTVDADSELGTGEFRLLCDRTNPPELEADEIVDAVADRPLVGA